MVSKGTTERSGGSGSFLAGRRRKSRLETKLVTRQTLSHDGIIFPVNLGVMFAEPWVSKDEWIIRCFRNV